MNPARIISSPHVRCIQTMQPLARKAGLEIEQSTSLTPRSPSKALEMLRESGSTSAGGRGVVHAREVIGRVLKELASNDGLRLVHRPPGLEGCVWVLHIGKNGPTSARYIPPPSSGEQRTRVSASVQARGS